MLTGSPSWMNASTSFETSSHTAASDEPRLTLTILHHPDLDRVGERADLGLPRPGQQHELSRSEPDFAGSGWPLCTDRIFRRPILLRPTKDEGVLLDLTGSQKMELRIQGRDVPRPTYLVDAAQLRRGVVLELNRHVVLLLHLRAPAPDVDPTKHLPWRERFIGDSEALRGVLGDIRRYAGNERSVLILGESGTGKELVARSLHEASRRSGKPFVSVNLGGLQASTMMSALFGHTRGSFTGAEARRSGLFVEADGGTLFLDELGEAPLELQAALLRALEEREVVPLGSDRPRKVDVRVIAATDADLAARIAAGTFKSPLLHRLNALEIRTPPLRERRDDVGRLLVHFVKEELGDDIGSLDRAWPHEQPWLTARMVARLAEHDWPGNVRELRNLATRIVCNRLDGGAAERIVERACPRAETPAPPRVITAAAAPDSSPEPRCRAVTPADLMHAMEKHRWKVSAAAADLQLKPPTFYKKLKAAGIRTGTKVPEAELRSAYDEFNGDLDRMAQRLKVSADALHQRLCALRIRHRAPPRK